MRFLGSLVFLISFFNSFSQDLYPTNSGIDMLHYKFRLELNDTTDILDGQAQITIQIKKSISEFGIDLVSKNSSGKGMDVKRISLEETPANFVNFVILDDQIRVLSKSPFIAETVLHIRIEYSGIPQDGLIISKNTFGDRTFFGDNWPNRAHHWLPTVDHPSDKATCEFTVIAPDHYQVIGNGRMTEERSLSLNRKSTRWEETVPIPTKVMIIGVAPFAIQDAGRVRNIPVQSWVYPQNRDAGFSDYSVGVRILEFFDQRIGPYPYEKLANVQSTTRYGGMENASAIFYYEKSVTGNNTIEPTIAHEIAHQWFGDSASEKDWSQIWLSEGFATYFSHLYLEFAHGRDQLVENMKAERTQVIDYYKINQSAVIDTTFKELTRLLNAHSYQKGGWVLHMLRHQLGDTAFWKGIQTYYRTYRDSNAVTDDFRRIMEQVSGKDLSVFFQQWLRRGDHPKLVVDWKYNKSGKALEVTIKQVQSGPSFQIPLELGIKSADGGIEITRIQLKSKSQKTTIPVKKGTLEVVVDPETWLLSEFTVTPEK